MKKRVILFSILLLTLFGSMSKVSSVSAQENFVEIDFFYSALCPHCKEEGRFLDIIKEEYSDLKINRYEISGNKEGQETLRSYYERYGVAKQSWGLVPVTFISGSTEEYFVGFSEQISEQIRGSLGEKEGEQTGESSIPSTITIPFLGKIDISKMSLVVLTITLAALDGFNPCAMWVLLFLLTLLLNVHSRKKMCLVGGIFILTSGIIYYLILAAWLQLFQAVSYMNLTRNLIGIFALAMGTWQIRNFINFRPGVCKVTDGEGGFQKNFKDNLKNQAEKLVSSPMGLGVIIGIIFLAFGVNLVEFFCSAGLPAIFTRVLALNNVSNLNYYLYLLLYTVVFMIDDLIIFSVAFFTLSKIGFNEKYNYWSTLIGGVLIFILGFLLIFKPELLMFA